MLTRAEEFKADKLRLDAQIETEEKRLEQKEAVVSAIRVYIDRLRTRRAQVEVQLEREEARLVKPTGPCVKETDHNGVVWDI